MDELRIQDVEAMSRDRTGHAIGQMTRLEAESPDPAFAGGQDLEPIPRLAIAAVLLAVAIGGGVDIVLDWPHEGLSLHIALELTLMLASLALSIHLWRGWRATSHSLRVAQRTLVERDAERDAWRARASTALSGFAAAVDAQLSAWALTPTEREVALLLLEGLGHKQIAGSTGRSERTVRQHAVSVYGKAGVSGRAELAAFFLSGLSASRRSSSDESSGVR
jgi:DNA-binding CsgD family transcriptional regulator